MRTLSTMISCDKVQHVKSLVKRKSNQLTCESRESERATLRKLMDAEYNDVALQNNPTSRSTTASRFTSIYRGFLLGADSARPLPGASEEHFVQVLVAGWRDLIAQVARMTRLFP